jgi:amino acid transporter
MSNNENSKLGLLDSSTILIGGMIGSAIFSLSGMTILNAGPASIISWIVAAIILYAYGLQTAELATIYPSSGGVFVFPAEALGKTRKSKQLIGWISAWAYLFGCLGGAAFSATYVGTYLGVAFPSLSNAQVIIALVTVVICGLLNLFNMSVTGKANTALTLLLIATMVAFVVIALFSGKWDAALFTPFFTQGASGSTGFITAIPIAMVAYGSIVAVSFMVGQIKDPNKTIPKAMSIAMGVVTALYVLVMVAVLGLVSSQFLQENPGMAYIPLYAAAFTSLSSITWLTKLISISAVLALITTIIVLIQLSARTLQAAALDKVLPKCFARENEKTKVATVSTVVVIAVIGLLSAFPSFTNMIVNLGALSCALVIAIISVTVLAARKKHPHVEGGFKAPGGNVLPVITLILLVACYVPDIINGGWKIWAYTAAYMIIGYIIYLVCADKAE